MGKTITSNITRAKKGDQRAFNAIVREWYPRIYNFACKYFSTQSSRHAAHDLALEVCQKTFISVHKNLPKLNEEHKFKPWLYKIATNNCLEEDRKRHRNTVVPFVELGYRQENHLRDTHPASSPDPEKIARKADLQYWILHALSQIPEEQRLVIIMKEFEGLKFREIAQTLSVSENTVKSRMYYGLDAMKKILTTWKLDKEKMLYE